MRYPEFDGEWDSVNLGTIARFSKGKGVSKIDIEINAENECIRYGELYTHYGTVIKEIVSKTNLKKEDSILSEINDIIIPSSGETQIDIATASCVMKEDVILGGDLNIIKTPHNGVFLSYYLSNSKKFEIASLAQGVSVVHLYASQLALLKLSLPSQKEQNKLAEFLSLIDERISTQIKIIEELKNQKVCLTNGIFGQHINLKKQEKPPYTNWISVKLNELVAFLKGGGLSKSDLTEDGEFNCVHYGELFTLYKECITNVHSRTNKNGLMSKYGDILMPSSDVTPIGLATASVILKDDVVLGGDINVLRPNSNINPIFLSFILNYSKKQIIELVTGTTIKHIYSKDLKTLSLKIPQSLDEQKRIADYLIFCNKKIEIEQGILEGYKVQKQFLLQQMFI